MTTSDLEPKWQTAAILIGRLIFACVFLMAVSFKFAGMQATADYIAVVAERYAATVCCYTAAAVRELWPVAGAVRR